MRQATNRFEQLPLDKMETGLASTIATTRVEPAEISRRLGIRFEPARDDLDSMQAALLRSPSGRQFALVRHEHQPAPGTDLLTNENSCSIAHDLQELLAMLRMTVDDLGWVHPDAIAVTQIVR